MNIEDATMQLALDNELRKQELAKQFENLRPKWRTAIFNLLFGVAIIPVLYWLFPQTVQQPTIMVIIVLVLAVNMNSFHESRRINKRIDILHKMLKEDA